MLDDGSAVRITTARYHTPSGRVIQRPYERGKRREYYLDHLRRAAEADPDSLDTEAPAYRTLRTGRTVYGGGGIRPDILIEADTTEYSDYYAGLIRSGALHEFVTDYMARERGALERVYPDFEVFERGYEADEKVLADLVAAGEARGIAFDSEGFERSGALLRLGTKALVAQRLFGPESYYRVMNPARNDAYREAVALLRDWKNRGVPILKGE